jgi:hypothetical protein
MSGAAATPRHANERISVMKMVSIAMAVAGCALMGTAAMAQSADDPRYGRTPGTEYTALPGSPVFEAAPGAPADVYGPTWSRNPGVMNNFTSRPNFVEHSHGHP